MKHLKYLIAVLFVFIQNIACYAITDAEVQSAVSASGKEAVSGNLFIWFLCAIAFMKVSQKIDSFMSSLGVSVGRTGGSMMAEAMIVAKTIGGAMKGGASGFNRGASRGGRSPVGTPPAGAGGLIGGIGRKVTNSAVNNVTGGECGSGIVAGISRMAYENSVSKGGSFATNVISSVARGDISKMGTISGANGKTAMESYFGYNKQSNQSANNNSSHMSASQISMASNVSGEVVGRNMNENINSENISSLFSDSSEQAFTETMYMSGEGVVPTFSDIEMGGGRITGFELTPDNPSPVEFAMYDAEKYVKPEGNFETVTAVDNSKWYKQYAMPTVEKTPFMGAEGKIQYNETIVNKIPSAPKRKDKI